MRRRPTLLLLSEDAAADAWATVRRLLLRMLRLVEPSFREDVLLFQPLDDKHAQRAVHGNLWKSKSPRDREHRIALLREIATFLLQGEDSFVVFHFDGDRPWAERAQSENVARFQGMRRDVLTQMQRTSRRDEELEEALRSRLLTLVPFYSIESWLYQNIDPALALCRALHRGRHEAQLLLWQQERGALDELLRPKEVGCLGSAQNLRLAEDVYPARLVYQVGKSFTAAVDGLGACEELGRALRTVSYGARDPS